MVDQSYKTTRGAYELLRVEPWKSTKKMEIPVSGSTFGFGLR
jgi:hypothetical protein